jgi:hypothetical protein
MAMTARMMARIMTMRVIMPMVASMLVPMLVDRLHSPRHCHFRRRLRIQQLSKHEHQGRSGEREQRYQPNQV